MGQMKRKKPAPSLSKITTRLIFKTSNCVEYEEDICKKREEGLINKRRVTKGKDCRLYTLCPKPNTCTLDYCRISPIVAILSPVSEKEKNKTQHRHFHL